MNPRPVSQPSARSGRFRLLLVLSLVVGVLPACSGDVPDDPPPRPTPGVARLEVEGGSAEPGEELLFRCIADDARGGPLTYAFDFGDGEGVTHYADPVPNGTPFELAHVFSKEGRFEARCRALDAEEREGPWSERVGYTIHRPGEGSGRLEVQVDVFGRGKVTTTPARLDCPGTCRVWFDAGTEITLTPVPESGWRFVGWWGKGCGARDREGPRTFTLDSREFCLARFAPETEASAEWQRTGVRLPRSPVWSPDGTRLAAFDSPLAEVNRLLVWDAETGRLVKEFSAGLWARNFTAVAWSPLGDRVALGRAEGSILLLDTTTWAPVLEWKAQTRKVGALAWSPDGLRLASADDTQGTVSLWNARTGTSGGSALSAAHKVRRLAWSPDGARIAVEAGPALMGTEYQPWVELHGVASGRLEELHTNAASFAWSPDGTRYAVGGLREVRIHASATHALANTWAATGNTVELLDWSRDGRWLGAGGRLGALVVLAADTGAVVADASSEAPPGPGERPYDTLRFHPSKPAFAVVKELPGAIDVFTFDAVAHTVSTRELLPHRYAVHAVAWSPSGERLASAGDEGLVRLWDRQGAALRTLSAHAGKAVRALAWDATGTRLASGGADGQVRVWNAEDGTLVRAPLAHVNGPPEKPVPVEVHRVAFSPDGRLLASVSESRPDYSGNGMVRVWDLGSGAELFRFPARSRSVQALVWMGAGRYLLAATSDMTWELWDSQTGALRRVGFGLEVQTLAVALSPDETRLALGSQDGLLVKDVQTGALLQSVQMSEVAFGDLVPHALAWSPDGRRLAGGGVGGLVFVWDTQANLASTVAGFHDGDVNTVSWRSDGRSLTTGGSDSGLSTWRFAP